MDRYIGLDAHASSCTPGVIGPSGTRLGSHVVETNAKSLIELIRTLPSPRHLCLQHQRRPQVQGSSRGGHGSRLAYQP